MTLRTTLLLGGLLVASVALADPDDRLKLRDKAGDATAKLLKEPIDVDLNGTVAEALQTITKKTGWSLIASAPTLDQRLSLRTKKRPLGEALELVLEAADLKATLREGGKLIIKSHDSDDDDEEEEEAEEHDEDADDEDHGAFVVPPVPPIPPIPPVPPMPGSHRRGANDRTAFGQDLVIKKGEVVSNAVVNGGDLIVQGRITEEAVAMGGDIIVEKGGVIEGDASAMGGDVHIENGGIIKGSTQKFGGGAVGSVLKGLAKRSGKAREEHVDHDDDDDFSVGGFGTKVLLAVLAFILNIMLIAFVPERIERVIRTLDERPLQSGGAGFAMLLGFLPFCLMLVVTIVGIALVPLAFVAYLFTYVIGYAALSVYIGRRLPFLKNRKTVLGAMGLGLGALTCVVIIPYLGPIIVFLASSFAAGSVVLSRVGSGPKIIDESAPLDVA